MRVIVAGGTGFIGSRLVEHLLENGHEPVVLSRNKSKVEKRFGDRVVPAEWDSESSRGWIRHIEEFEGKVGIVNFVGESLDGRWTDEKKRRILNSRVRSGRAVSEACERAVKKPEVLVQGSAVGWYGPRGDEQVDESSEPGEGFLAEVCRKWEASTEAVEKLKTRRVIARTGIVLGEGGILKKFESSFKLYLGGPLGSGKQWISWIHILDQVRAITFLLESETASGPFNLTAPNPVTMREFTDALGRAMGRPSFFRVPSTLLRLGLGEMAEEMILHGQKVYPAKLLEKNFDFMYDSIDGALSQLE